MNSIKEQFDEVYTYEEFIDTLRSTFRDLDFDEDVIDSIEDAYIRSVNDAING